MSNTETTPAEVVCDTGNAADPGATAPVQVLVPRDVPLGGPRAMNVRRTLPQRQRSLIGAWCFLDHYGPDPVGDTGGMNVPRHPHIGLQTASWLFTGEVEHKDSAGFEAVVRPGELNLMTAGQGISHSEFSTPDTTILHGAQLWIALPDSTRNGPPTFEHFRPEPLAGNGFTIRVFLGELAGCRSPVRTHTPLVGAELGLEAGARFTIELDPTFEHGILADSGSVVADDVQLPADHLGYLATGRESVTLEAVGGSVRLLLIGGEPLGERIVMWWNFVGRTHEEIVTARERWQFEIGLAPGSASSGSEANRREGGLFGPFPAGQPEPLPAPIIPPGRLRARE